jgi:hypothetical protein
MLIQYPNAQTKHDHLTSMLSLCAKTIYTAHTYTAFTRLCNGWRSKNILGIAGLALEVSKFTKV